MDAFLQWLAINGYHQDLLAPADFPDTGRGMKALRDIKAGDVIVEIPDALLFTATTKAVKDVTSELCPDATHLSEHATLALFLAFHRHGPHHPPHPNFSPYMDVLPTEFSTVGCVGASQRVQSAMPARMRRLCDAVKGRLDEDYASVGGGQTVERKDFEWGWMCVNTRCISLTRKTNSTTSASCPTIALAPMLDLLNHHPATTTTALYTPHKHFRLTTHEDVRVGDQVFISYGAHDNEFLAAEYGFVVAENMWDMAEVEGMDVGVGMGSGDGGVVEGVLRACGLDGGYTLHADHDPPPRLLAALRIHLLASLNSPSSTSLPRDISTTCWLELPNPTAEQRVRARALEICERVRDRAVMKRRELNLREGDEECARMVDVVWQSVTEIAEGTMKTLIDDGIE